MSDSTSNLLATFLGALEGTASVLLTITAGYLTANSGLLSRQAVKQISKVSTLLFLPCLIVVQMGPQLTVGELGAWWIMPVWGLVSSSIAHGVGWVGKSVLGLHEWTIIAAGRANANALPLLLLQSLENTGVLDTLKRPGDSISTTLDRAKGIVLLNSIVQQMITFSLGPTLLRHQKKNGQKSSDADPESLTPGSQHPTGMPTVQDSEHVGLLEDYDGHDERDPREALTELEDTPDVRIKNQKLRKVIGVLRRATSWMSPPVWGAIVAFVVGMIPPLNHAFFDEKRPLYSIITQTVKNLGQLFVVLQMFVLGAELQVVPSASPGFKASTFVLLIRYVFMPAASLGFVWWTAGRGWYVNDPLVWFLLILVPAGPSAMLLINLAELMNVDQGPVSGFLIISYALAPLMAAVCALGLKVIDAVEAR